MEAVHLNPLVQVQNLLVEDPGGGPKSPGGGTLLICRTTSNASSIAVSKTSVTLPPSPAKNASSFATSKNSGSNSLQAQ